MTVDPLPECPSGVGHLESDPSHPAHLSKNPWLVVPVSILGPLPGLCCSFWKDALFVLETSTLCILVIHKFADINLIEALNPHRLWWNIAVAFSVDEETAEDSFPARINNRPIKVLVYPRKEIEPHTRHLLPPFLFATQSTMLGALLRRNMSQKLSILLLVFGLVWGVMLLRYTVQQPRHQSSTELREQILELSRQYVKVLTEENEYALGGPQGTSMAGYGKWLKKLFRITVHGKKNPTNLIWFLFLLHTADLKRTIAVLLDDILTRLIKLEGKMDLVVNASSANTSHTAGGVLPSAAMQRSKQGTPGSHWETSRLHPHIPVRP